MHAVPPAYAASQDKRLRWSTRRVQNRPLTAHWFHATCVPACTGLGEDMAGLADEPTEGGAASGKGSSQVPLFLTGSRPVTTPRARSPLPSGSLFTRKRKGSGCLSAREDDDAGSAGGTGQAAAAAAETQHAPGRTPCVPTVRVCVWPMACAPGAVLAVLIPIQADFC